MTIITDIQKQVIDSGVEELKLIFKTIFDAKIEESEKFHRNVWHDSDIEDIKYALEEKGIEVTWKALYKFLDPDFNEEEWESGTFSGWSLSY